MPAGYVMTMSDGPSIERAVRDGIYSTLLKNQPDGFWGAPGYGTFADYASMKPGDNIYFFSDRHIYGVGELAAVKGACAHLNFPGATEPKAFDYDDVSSALLYDVGPASVRQRWLCTFRPEPYFFTRGVDMDEALSAHPDAFRMLRVLWKLSFIKLDYEENAALKDVLLRANRGVLSAGESPSDVYSSDWQQVHATVAARMTTTHQLDVAPMLERAARGDALRSEMALEASVLQYLTNHDQETEETFGAWDYVSHQVAASPFKPPDWMDKVDVFGAAFIAGHAPSIDRLLVAELKKDAADAPFVQQVMKYVDWVKDEYAHQDYSHIRAYLVAYDFTEAALEAHAESAVRVYTVGRRPPVSKEWRELRLVRYRFNADVSKVAFDVIASPPEP